jgi:hypothetical protein
MPLDERGSSVNEAPDLGFSVVGFDIEVYPAWAFAQKLDQHRPRCRGVFEDMVLRVLLALVHTRCQCHSPEVAGGIVSSWGKVQDDGAHQDPVHRPRVTLGLFEGGPKRFSFVAKMEQ